MLNDKDKLAEIVIGLERYERINRENPLPAIEAICSQINRLKQVRKDEAYGIGSFLVIAGLVALVIRGSSE